MQDRVVITASGDAGIDNIILTPVPEPSALVLLGLGGSLLLGYAWCRRRATT